MQVVYEPWLVLLSIVMAIQGAYVGFTLASQLGDAVGVRRRVLLAGAAFSLAVAVWTMHFVGMLAARISFPIDYLVFPTLLSLLVCVLVVGVAVFAISSGPFSLPRLFLSACLMGGGIFSMHYIGMTALHASAHMEHAPFFVMASLIIAIVASGLALWLARGEVRRPPLILSSVAFGIAVSGMHYTAMAGMKLFPLPATSSAPALSTDLLAIVVAVVAFCVSGIFLLVLVPDRTRGESSLVNIAPEPALVLQVTDANGVPVQPVKSRDGENSVRPRNLRAARRCRWAAAAHCTTSAGRAGWRDAIHCGRRRCRRSRQRSLHLCLQRHPQAVLSIGDRRSGIAARQEPVYSCSPQPHHQYRPGHWTSTKRRQRDGRAYGQRPLLRSRQPQPHRLAEVPDQRAGWLSRSRQQF